MSVLYGFAGRQVDLESGTYYSRARNYDPMIGRFMQKDPIGFGGGDLNLYRYVKNNPKTSIDPFGLKIVNSTGKPIPPLVQTNPIYQLAGNTPQSNTCGGGIAI